MCDTDKNAVISFVRSHELDAVAYAMITKIVMNRRKRQRAVEKWGGEEKGGKYGNDRRDKKRLKEKANDMKGRANKGRIEKRQ